LRRGRGKENESWREGRKEEGMSLKRGEEKAKGQERDGKDGEGRRPVKKKPPIHRCVWRTGRYAPDGNAQASSVPTDPAMILVTSDERFATTAGISTANFCDNQNVSCTDVATPT